MAFKPVTQEARRAPVGPGICLATSCQWTLKWSDDQQVTERSTLPQKKNVSGRNWATKTKTRKPNGKPELPTVRIHLASCPPHTSPGSNEYTSCESFNLAFVTESVPWRILYQQTWVFELKSDLIEDWEGFCNEGDCRITYPHPRTLLPLKRCDKTSSVAVLKDPHLLPSVHKRHFEKKSSWSFPCVLDSTPHSERHWGRIHDYSCLFLLKSSCQRFITKRPHINLIFFGGGILRMGSYQDIKGL